MKINEVLKGFGLLLLLVVSLHPIYLFTNHLMETLQLLALSIFLVMCLPWIVILTQVGCDYINEGTK